MLRRAWKPALGATAATLCVGAPLYYYYNHNGRRQEPRDTFNISEQVDARLREHATAQAVARPGGVVWKSTTAHFASNDPIEDAHGNLLVERNAAPADGPAPPAGDYLFFAVMDGHAGFSTSRTLAKVLIPVVTMELARCVNEPQAGGAVPYDANPENVARSIEKAFVDLDSKIVNGPLEILADNVDDESLKKKLVPDLSQHPLAAEAIRTAMSGSCALLAMFDTAHRNLYVAVTGDSRAVAGVFEETADGKGVWRVEALTEDQTGRNPNELKRLQSEHPADEADNVVRNGRILGGLEPSRAFGDARYKWPREVQETPPYVTARPVVTHRPLAFLPLPADPTAPAPKSALRFVVLATDGLWDELANEEVVALVGGHLAGLRGTVPKADLARLVPTAAGSAGVDGKSHLRGQQDARGAWAFEDDNLSTHLIRNALGGGDVEHLRKLASIPAPYSRRFRDDITVTVVWWEDGREAAAQTDQWNAEGHTRAPSVVVHLAFDIDVAVAAFELLSSINDFTIVGGLRGSGGFEQGGADQAH
ncbi:protein serine/threonine phosphatase 2C [Epithele typhae]|uniref:protein serine/threonine phosphatase 2C n=1 Tax=Epithele typhae TaxID=378194 RepID=UPI0020072DE4|nr:protein serine/threonine phosphatase 2C [Epithele typhae]KAH9943231.1 protein serine/threonine phosphatase 2C [Epithele typhae]